MTHRRFIGIKTKVLVYTIIPAVVCFLLICSILIATLLRSQNETAKAEFLYLGQKYAATFQKKVNDAVSYLTIVSNAIESYMEEGNSNRENLQKTAFYIFDNYDILDGSSIYFEPDMYDGKDAEYVGTQYGTGLSGRICYYFYKDNGETAYLPEGIENDIEFSLPHYTEAKAANKPVYTKPAVHEIEGRAIPMFTITYPINDKSGAFIGAVTVDLFLKDIYAQLQSEKVYATGYMIIASQTGHVIYSPRFDDIGKTREEAGLNYPLPPDDVTSMFYNAQSIINGKDTLLSIEAIYIPQLDSRFYVSVAAPLDEIGADGARLSAGLMAFCALAVLFMAFGLYYVLGKVLAPIRRITDSANRIANGDTEEAEAFIKAELPEGSMNEVLILSEALSKMLAQVTEVQKLRLEALELKYKKDQAEETSRAKSTFLANMSHEIRTPMNGIIGFSELALDADIPPETSDYLSKIKASAESLLQIINDILDISKIEAGKMELERTPFDLGEVFKLCRIVTTPKALEKGISLFCYAEPTMNKLLVGDPTRLRQALINLLANAVKFTNTGVVKLMSDIEIRDDGKAYAHFEVRDSGIGMTAEQIERVFQPFTQADGSTTRKYGGTGLGLTITQSIVEAMGGRLDVESTPGLGSKFSFDVVFDTVDRPAGSPEKGDAEGLIERPVFEGEVLVCEDNEINRQVIRDHLTRVGLGCAMAENGRDAVEIVKSRLDNNEKPFDLIFMDIHMPVMDGMEAARKLAQIGNKTPIVALTANIMTNDTAEYLSSGMADCMPKPFRARELWACLLKFLTPLGVSAIDRRADMKADEKSRSMLFSTFVANHSDTYGHIEEAMRSGDITLAHRLAHTLKGVAGIINLSALQKAAQAVEHSLARGRADATEAQLNDLKSELDAAIEQLRPIIERLGKDAARAPLSIQDADALLNKLDAMLEQDSFESLVLVDEIKLLPGSEALIAEIERFSFKRAREALACLRGRLQ